MRYNGEIILSSFSRQLYMTQKEIISMIKECMFKNNQSFTFNFIHYPDSNIYCEIRIILSKS